MQFSLFLYLYGVIRTFSIQVQAKKARGVHEIRRLPSDPEILGDLHARGFHSILQAFDDFLPGKVCLCQEQIVLGIDMVVKSQHKRRLLPRIPGHGFQKVKEILGLGEQTPSANAADIIFKLAEQKHCHS